MFKPSSESFGWPFVGGSYFVDPLCYLCFTFVFIILSCRFLTALWQPSGKGLTSWLSCVWCFSCVFVNFPYGVSGQVWHLIVSIPDLCHLLYFSLRISTDIFAFTHIIFASLPTGHILWIIWYLIVPKRSEVPQLVERLTWDRRFAGLRLISGWVTVLWLYP